MEKTIPKYSIKKQKVTNATNVISPSEPPSSKEIMVEKTIRCYVSFFSVGTGASVTPENIISRKKNNMKSPEMSPPRKHPIPNQYIKKLSTKNIKVFHHN